LQILCEGKDDTEFFSRLVVARGLTDYHCMCPIGEDSRCIGKGGFRKHLDLIVQWIPSGVPLKGIVIVADCDDDPEAAFREVRRSVLDAGFPDPETPQTIRTNRSGPAPTFAIMMAPWHDRPGNLELVIWEALEPLFVNHVEGIQAFSRHCGAHERTISLQAKFNLRCLIAAMLPTDPSRSLVYFLQRPREICPIDHFDPSFSQMYDFLKDFADAVMGRQ
jgi:hypothetical protein